jgi:hypothetical protein
MFYNQSMRYHFTKHAQEKIERIRKAGFLITHSTVKQAISKPIRIEDRLDGTRIAMTFLNRNHVLRVVYRIDDDIIVIITLYPARRKAYGI